MQPTEDQIRQWKQDYGQVYSVTDRGDEYVFRALTYREFDIVVRTSPESSAEAEEEVVNQGLLYPEELPPRAPAGLVTSLAERIMEVSGFGSPKRMKAVLEQKRVAASSDLRTLMKAFIMASMPIYTEEELDDYTFDQLAWKLALAEQVLKVQQSSIGIENEIKLDIIDPEEEEEKAAQERQLHAVAKKEGTAGFNDPIAARLHQALR